MQDSSSERIPGRQGRSQACTYSWGLVNGYEACSQQGAEGTVGLDRAEIHVFNQSDAQVEQCNAFLLSETKHQGLF